MTQRLPVPAAPGPLEAYCQQFDPLFRQRPQRDRFRRYLEGLLLPAERNKTLTALANTEPVTGAQHPQAQSLQWFLSESTWDAETVNERRIAALRKDPTTAPTADGVLVIDEHGDRKWGSKTAHIGKQYLANLGKIDTGVVSVTSLWADEELYYPVHVEPYTPAHHFAQGKADPDFRTKLAIAVELVQQAVNAGIPFRAVVADCFYGEDHGVQQGIRGLGKGYVLAQSLVRGEIAEIGVDLSTKSGFRTVIAEDRLGSRRPEEEAHRHRHPIWEIRVLCPVVLVPSVPGSCPRPHPSSPVKRLHSMPPWTRSWCAVSAPSPSSYPSWNRSISAPSSIATLSQPASRPPIKIGGLLAL